MNIVTVANYVVYANALVAWTFIIAYWRITRGAWRHTQIGVNLMSLVMVHAALFTMLTLVHVWPVLAHYGWYLWTYVAVIFAIAVVIMWRTCLLWCINHPRDRR